MIIPFDDRYEFVFLEEYDINLQHPASNYYLKLDDMSVNLLISLKWIEWGYRFLELLKKELDNLDDDFKLENITSKSLQKLDKENKKDKIIILDDEEVSNNEKFREILKDFYLDKPYFDKNTKIHLKLKINLSEFLIISNMLYPSLIKWKENISFE